MASRRRCRERRTVCRSRSTRSRQPIPAERRARSSPASSRTTPWASSCGQAVAEDAVGEGRQVRTVFLEHASLQDDHGSITIECANLARVEIANPDDLRDGGLADERQTDGDDGWSKRHGGLAKVFRWSLLCPARRFARKPVLVDSPTVRSRTPTVPGPNGNERGLPLAHGSGRVRAGLYWRRGIPIEACSHDDDVGGARRR